MTRSGPMTQSDLVPMPRSNDRIGRGAEDEDCIRLNKETIFYFVIGLLIVNSFMIVYMFVQLAALGSSIRALTATGSAANVTTGSISTSAAAAVSSPSST